MTEVKKMTYHKKLIAVLNLIKLLDAFVLPLVKKQLGSEWIDELKRIWLEKLKEIPQDISDKDKFEIAYSNWMWKWSIAFKFIKEHLGEKGIEEFKKADIEAWKKKDSRLKMMILKRVQTISPNTAFSIVERQMAYEFQVFSPAKIKEFDKERLVFDIPQCKLLDFPECEDVCQIGCQEIFPKLFAEHLNIKMDTDRHGKSCTVTLAPLR